METNRLLSPFILLIICTVGQHVQGTDEQLDTRIGNDVTLRCRVGLAYESNTSLTYYWIRSFGADHDVVAIGNVTLEKNYRITYMPSEGRFDLTITSIKYERDNGRFECRVKKGGSGEILHSQVHDVVVLIEPQPPVLNTGPHVQLQEGELLNLTCSSTGGSPSPVIQWYQDGVAEPLKTEILVGKSLNEPTVAMLLLELTPEYNRAVFRCLVRHRAILDDQKMEANVDLSVKYNPRVKVGPANPLRTEVNSTVTMWCQVDSNPSVSKVRWTRAGQFITDSLYYMIKVVTMEDAGNYICSADNELGSPGESEMYLDVLYPPVVTVASKTYEADEGNAIEIRCDVSSNPEPISIDWTMEGRTDFHKKGNTLLLPKVDAYMAGTYICSAENVLFPTNGTKKNRVGSTSVALLVRHKPGKAHISPEHPIAREGLSVTLTCTTIPEGWPAPQYRWYRKTETGSSKPKVLVTGNKYTIPNVHVGVEGAYQCQAVNEFGHSSMAHVNLQVYQPPRLQFRLQPHMIKNAGDKNFSLTCVAVGKPQPSVKWYKDNVEILPDSDWYEINRNVSEIRNAVYNVESNCIFKGKARPNGDSLLPADRGVYSCAFQNEVRRVESTMNLRIEHQPISIRLQKKVAADIAANAELKCLAQAYPKPEFQWFYGTNSAPLQMPDGHYEIITTPKENDTYLSVLIIKNVKNQDYGAYVCSVNNSLGHIRPKIGLQPKSAPEPPVNLFSLNIDATYVTLKWEEGFNGGLSTKYFVRYRRLHTASAAPIEHCPLDDEEFEWKEHDCGQANPCNVTHIEQHNAYLMKVKAVNTKGQSAYSNEISVTTKVGQIMPPDQVTYDPESKVLGFSVGPTCLPLVAVLECLDREQTKQWQVVGEKPLQLSGVDPVFQQTMYPFEDEKYNAPSLYFKENPRLRIKVCLVFDEKICSPYVVPKIGPPYSKQGVNLTTATVVAIVVSCLFFLLFLSLLFIFYCCKRKENTKQTSKDYEMDSISSPLGPPPNKPPPPYYPNSGKDNNALEKSMDLPLSIDDSNVYSTQAGYGYNIAPHTEGHPGQDMSNTDWVNMGYIENSYANSNHGGSVNSQDSLWQMKMAAASNPPGMSPHQMIDRQSNYGYDPIAHGGYGTMDDYAPYPLPPGAHLAAPEYRAAQTPSRQDYCSDPYASVHKPKKRIDQHMESPYHEVSGLPEAYGAEDAAGEKPPHLSLSYDESLESGYSTPNSRARKVIREIIV